MIEISAFQFSHYYCLLPRKEPKSQELFKGQRNSRTQCWLIEACCRAWFYITMCIYVENRQRSKRFHWLNVMEVHVDCFTKQCRPTVIARHDLFI